MMESNTKFSQGCPTLIFSAFVEQYFGHFLSDRVNKKGHSWLNVRVQRDLQPENGL